MKLQRKTPSILEMEQLKSKEVIAQDSKGWNQEMFTIIEHRKLAQKLKLVRRPKKAQ